MLNQLLLSDGILMNYSHENVKKKNDVPELATTSESEIASRTTNVEFGAQPELARDLVVAEYNSLTTELNSRQSIRYQMIQFSLAALAALLSVSAVVIQNHLDFLIFAYPVLVLVLSIIYTTNTFESRRIKNYLKIRIEIFLPAIKGEKIGWHTFRKSNKIEGFGTVGNIGAKTIFIITSVFAVLMGIQIMHQGEISEVLLKVAVGATILLIFLLLSEGLLFLLADKLGLLDIKHGEASDSGPVTNQFLLAEDSVPGVMLVRTGS